MNCEWMRDCEDDLSELKDELKLKYSKIQTTTNALPTK